MNGNADRTTTKEIRKRHKESEGKKEKRKVLAFLIEDCLTKQRKTSPREGGVCQSLYNLPLVLFTATRHSPPHRESRHAQAQPCKSKKEPWPETIFAMNVRELYKDSFGFPVSAARASAPSG